MSCWKMLEQRDEQIKRLNEQIVAMSKRNEKKVQHDAEIIHKLLTKLKKAGIEVGNDE